MIEGLQLTIPRRMGFIKIIITLALLLSVLSSFNLWCGERTFPQIPIWEGFYLTTGGEISLLIAYCFLLLSSMFLRRQRLILFLSIVVASIFVMADLNRLQPWFYFYNAMLLIFVFYNGRVDDSNKFTSYFIILQLIVASVYFFSGLNRFNSGFIAEEFTTTIAPMQQVLSERHFLFFIKIGKVMPYLLVFTGLGLIITPIRYLAFALVILLHMVLFFLLAPPFSNYNYPLWISNVVFILVAVFLFSGKTKQRYFSPTFLLKMPLFYMMVLLFLIAPFFANTALWPGYLSTDFKNDKSKNSVIKLNEDEYVQITNYQKSFCTVDKSDYLLDYKAWCLHELNASCHIETLVQTKLESHIRIVNAKSSKNKQLALSLK